MSQIIVSHSEFTHGVVCLDVPVVGVANPSIEARTGRVYAKCLLVFCSLGVGCGLYFSFKEVNENPYSHTGAVGVAFSMLLAGVVAGCWCAVFNCRNCRTSTNG